MDKTIEIEAKELIDSFKDFVAIDHKYDEAPIFECQKQCALIALDKILKELNYLKKELLSPQTILEGIEFYQSIKSHILKM